MKHRFILSLALGLAGCGMLSAAEPKAQAAGREKDAVAELSATLSEDADRKAQYALDSLKYAAQYELQTSLAKLANQRYKDSVVYSQMGRDQLFAMQMKQQVRGWRSDYELFMENVFPALVMAFCIMMAFWMVLKARDRGKQRAHELKMAQFEAMQKARVIYRERQRAGEAPEAASDSTELSFAEEKNDYARVFERTKRDLKTYMRDGRKFRKTGVILMIIGVGTMFFFLSVGGFRGPWGLGLIPIFIGLAYLYLDYSSKKTDVQRREMQEFLRYKSMKEAEKTPEEPVADTSSREEESL